MGSPLDSKDMASYVRPLIDLAHTLNPRRVLEIGIGNDAYSTQIWLRETACHLTTVDKCDWDGWALRLKSDRFTFIEGRSEVIMPQLEPGFDLIYIDGDHAYEGVKADIVNAQKLIADDGVILLDDYGVDFPSAVDIVDGRTIVDVFGVKQAVDEVFDNKWERVHTNIVFGNGGVAWRKRAKKAKSGVR